MKLVIFLLFFSFSLFAQDQPSFLSIGIEVAPILHTKEVNNLQELSFSPNLTIKYGSEQFKLTASLGVISRFGFTSSNKWTYASGYYMVNTISNTQLEHGAEIELGFNHTFGECKNIKLNIGSSIGLLNQGRASKLTLRPLVIGFTYRVI